MDFETVRETLTALAEAAPALSARVEAVAQEADLAQATVREFLRGLVERQTEATDLLARLEAGLGEVRREAETAADLRIALGTGGGEAGTSTREPAEILNSPVLSFEDKLFLPCLEMIKRQEEAVEQMAAGWGVRREAEKALLASATGDAEAAVREAGEALNVAFEESIVQGAGLRGTVQGSRDGLAAQLDRVASEMEGHRLQGARDLDELAKDLGVLEAALVARLERGRDAIRVDGDRIEEEVGRRLDDLGEMLGRALEHFGRTVVRLDDLFKRANDECQDSRRHLVPLFQEVSKYIGHLKQAVESVREAARSVGLPF